MSTAPHAEGRGAEGSVGDSEPDGSEHEGTAEAAGRLYGAGLDYMRDVAELAAAELRLAALSGISIIALILVAAALVIVAWGVLVAVVGYLLVALGLPVAVAGLVLIGAHLLAAYLLWRAILRLSRSITLPALRRAVLSTRE